jgi:hypothetical protein
MKPKWQEDSSCVFAYRFCRCTCHRRDTAEKERVPKSIRRGSGKRSFVKAVGTIRQENRQGRGKLPPCMPQSECGAGHTGYRTSFDPSPGGSQDTGGAFRSRVQRHGVRHRSIGAGHICPMWQRTDPAQVKRDRHTGKPQKPRNTKPFRLRQSNSFAEMRRKQPSLPMGEVRPSEHDFKDKEISLYDHERHLPNPRYPAGQAGSPQPTGQLPHEGSLL